MLRRRPLPAPGDAGSSLALSFSEARALEDHARRKRIKKYLTWSCEPSKKKEELCDWGGSAGGRESRSANENSETAATETEGERKREREREREKETSFLFQKKAGTNRERERARPLLLLLTHGETRAPRVEWVAEPSSNQARGVAESSLRSPSSLFSFASFLLSSLFFSLFRRCFSGCWRGSPPWPWRVSVISC